jgi:hypothetical protein
MAKKTTKLRPWTKEDVRMMKALARENVAQGHARRRDARGQKHDNHFGTGRQWTSDRA